MNIALSSPGSLFFSSAIPFLTISGVQGKLSVEISADGNMIFTTTLHISQLFNFDMRSIVVDYLEARKAAFAGFSISARENTGGAQPQAISFSVIYSRGAVGDASEFTQARFLTLSDTKLLPVQSAYDSLSIYSEEPVSGSLEITYLVDGQRKTDIGKTLTATAGLSRLELDFESILQNIPAGAVPVSALVIMGDRTMQYYFSPRHQSAAISFLNNFNCPEHIWLFGSWKRSGKISRKTASCGSETIAQAAEIEPEFDITSHPLTFRQAYIIPEISISPAVFVYLFAGGSPLALSAFRATPRPAGGGRAALAASTFKAVPKEGSLDASPQDAEPTAYTIKVIAAEKPAALGFNFEIRRIFTEQFQSPFT